MQRMFFLAVAAIGAAAALVAPTWAGTTQSGPARAAGRYLEPTAMSPLCATGARHSACNVVTEFFRAMNSGRYRDACALLGERLRTETYGLQCARFLALGMPEPMPWGILGASRAGPRVAVLVTLGQSELDHIRMRRHRANVGIEDGALRILDTQLVG